MNVYVLSAKLKIDENDLCRDVKNSKKCIVSYVMKKS